MNVDELKEQLLSEGKTEADFLNEDGSTKSKKELVAMLEASGDSSHSESKNEILAGPESEKLQAAGYRVAKIYRGEDGKKYHDLVKG